MIKNKVTISKDSFFCSDVGINNVTITAYYQNGDVKTCNSVVTIVDTISPIVGCVDTSIYISAETGKLVGKRHDFWH